jgi:hypothetical protein
MKIISIFILFLLTAGLLVACTNNQTSSPVTSVPSQANNSPTEANIETAYPLLSGNEAATPYPILGETEATPLPSGVLPVAPNEAPKPEAGMASISGVLYSYTTGQTVGGTEFFLIPGVGPEKKDVPIVLVAPDASRGEIIGRSDDNGNIALQNIPPGNYFLIVWAPMSWSVAEKSNTDKAPLLLELDAESQIPLGVIYLSWP